MFCQHSLHTTGQKLGNSLIFWGFSSLCKYNLIRQRRANIFPIFKGTEKQIAADFSAIERTHNIWHKHRTKTNPSAARYFNKRRDLLRPIYFRLGKTEGERERRTYTIAQLLLTIPCTDQIDACSILLQDDWKTAFLIHFAQLIWGTFGGISSNCLESIVQNRHINDYYEVSLNDMWNSIV